MRLLLATLPALLALAGCAGQAPGTGTTTVSESCGSSAATATCTTTTQAPPPGGMGITGLVESDAFVPLPLANVSIPELGLRTATNQAGRFTFPDVAPSVYNVVAEAAGYASQTQVARPEVTALSFILQRAAPTQPYNVTLPFHGLLECASETLIISGPCDAVVQYGGGPAVFQNNSAFPFRTDLAWQTMVIDLEFDASGNPGIDGLRETLRGQNDTASLGTYQQYGRFHDSQSFSVRVEPGGNYTDGDAPVPANVTSFKLEIYPQGMGYHQVCDPGSGQCFLGLGGAVNMRFDLFVTLFYVDPAPAGFTLLG
jgi:hypothetical protein